MGPGVHLLQDVIKVHTWHLPAQLCFSCNSNWSPQEMLVLQGPFLQLTCMVCHTKRLVWTQYTGCTSLRPQIKAATCGMYAVLSHA